MIMKHNPQIDYDPAVIQLFAQHLYNKARWFILIGATAGFLVGYVLAALADPGMNLLGAIAGCLIGYQIGAGAGLRYRIEAQQALCLAQIEKNTRPS